MKIATKLTLVATMVAFSACTGRISGPQTFSNEDGSCTEITFYSDSIVRVLRYPESVRPETNSWAVTMEPKTIKVKSHNTENGVILESKGISLEILRDGQIRYYDVHGNSLLKDIACRFTARTEGVDKDSYYVSQSFGLDSDEAIYGLGYDQSGKMSLRGHERRLEQLNSDDVIPFIHSVKGYGILWDNNSVTDFADNADGMHLTAEVGDYSDYYLVLGGNADGVVSQMRKLTGHVPMLPLWSYGFWQSRERYKTQEELLEVLETYRNLGVPIDGIIQDWRYWGEFPDWNAMEFLDPGFHDPQAMIDAVHENNAHIIISVWPSFGRNTDIYAEMAEGNHLYPQYTWPPVANVYDAFSDEANAIYWKHLKKMFDMGMDGWWMDASEPEIWNGKDEEKEFMTEAGSIRRVGNAYPLLEVGNVYNEQRKANSDKRVFILTRSVFSGQQRYGANTWTGDTDASWQTLRNQIAAGLNYTLSGNPNFNCDLGAFTVGSYNDKGQYGTAVNNRNYRELYTRWVQFGAFSAMMRSHGTDSPREFYLFGKAGEPIYDALVSAVKLRYSLIPYIYSTSWQISSADASLMRPLVMDFAKDRNTWDIGSEFMFGNSILVAPVSKAQFTSEDAQPAGRFDDEVDFSGKRPYEVYLPEGSNWFDFNTEQSLSGGQTLAIETGINDIPIYIKAGSILPIGPDVQYVGEKSWEELEIRVYPGENASFVLYEDKGDGYEYENGKYTLIEMKWNDAEGEFTFSDIKGSFDGMLANRVFMVRKAGSDSVSRISYNGSKVSVTL